MNLNIDLKQNFPPEIPHLDEFKRLSDLYAGRTIGSSADVITPDPDLADAYSEHTRERRKVRSNITADIASSVAAFVVGDGITINSGSDTVDQVLELSGFDNSVLQIAETASVFGGAFVRVNYQPALSPVPEIVVSAPVSVAPLFVGSILVSATFWQTVKISGSKVWRWVEHRDNQTRTITNYLFEGGQSTWGARVALDSIMETSNLVEEAKYPGGLNRLVWYVPNLLPNRRHLNSPHGRSDFAGSESLIATTDLLYTSLVRDFRLGRTRLIVPVDALSTTTHHGKVFDHERELYTTLDIDPSSDGGKPQLIEGKIRSLEHLEALKEVTMRIISNAGMTPTSFGIGDFGVAMSGTALLVREGKTISTVNAKRRHLKPAILDLVATIAALYGVRLNPLTIGIDFPPVRREAGRDLGQTLQLLTQAGLVSTETGVRWVHPDWTDEQVTAEVERIREQAPVPLDNPPSVGE